MALIFIVGILLCKCIFEALRLCEGNPTTLDGTVGNDEPIEPAVSIQCETDPTGSGGIVVYEDQGYPITPEH